MSTASWKSRVFTIGGALFLCVARLGVWCALPLRYRPRHLYRKVSAK